MACFLISNSLDLLIAQTIAVDGGFLNLHHLLGHHSVDIFWRNQAELICCNHAFLLIWPVRIHLYPIAKQGCDAIQ